MASASKSPSRLALISAAPGRFGKKRRKTKGKISNRLCQSAPM
jgi:hypothetical protein